MPEPLKDFERIRARSPVLFGSNTKTGAIACIRRIISVLITDNTNVSISLDSDDFIIIKTKGYTYHGKLYWKIINRDSQDIVNKDGVLQEYYVFKAVCEELYIINDVDSKIVEIAYYNEGYKIYDGIRKAEQEELNGITIKFKISHKVFNYDKITLEDLQFISIEKEKV